MPFRVERFKEQGSGHARVRITCEATEPGRRCVHRRPVTVNCWINNGAIAFRKCATPIDKVVQWIGQHRCHDEPCAWDILLALLPEKHQKIERRMMLAAERRLLGEG